MTQVMNAGTEPVWFRDAAGKHQLDPGRLIEVDGEQHVAHVLSLEGVRVATGADVPRGKQGGKRPAEDPVAPSAGEAGGRPQDQV